MPRIITNGAVISTPYSQIYAWTGQADAAFEWLEKALKDIRLADVLWYLRFETFANLHADPRWHELQSRFGIAPEQLAAIQFRVK